MHVTNLIKGHTIAGTFYVTILRLKLTAKAVEHFLGGKELAN
jgi:hypothetical protein